MSVSNHVEYVQKEDACWFKQFINIKNIIIKYLLLIDQIYPFIYLLLTS